MTTQDSIFSTLIINLMKGVVYKESDPELWQHLLATQTAISEYISVLGLLLLVDEPEGYAFLKNKEIENEEEPLPRLVGRRQLSYPVSLLLALLRYRLAEFDASTHDSRLIMSRDEVVDMMNTFLPAGINEAKYVDKIDTHINKIVELGFVRRLPGKENMLEIRRILKAYINAHWLNEMDQRLKEYQDYLISNSSDNEYETDDADTTF
jgi:hypothetical protein